MCGGDGDGGGSRRAVDDVDGLSGVVSDIMYVYGDAPRPRDECVQLLVRQLQQWQTRHIRLVTTEREGTAEKPGGVTLCRKRLRQHFPTDYDEHVLLQRLRQQARTAEEEDVAAPGTAEDDEDGEEQAAEEEEREEGAMGAMASRHAERHAFRDERTRDMEVEEYQQFAQRRQSASLSTLGFARKVAAKHGLLPSAVTRANGSMLPAFNFFLRLATTHVGAIVEAANRAAHEGWLRPPTSPLHQAHYLQAVREEWTKWKESAG